MRPELDTIAGRLQTRHEAIERALEAALARAGVTRVELAELARLGGRAGAARLEAAQRLEAVPAAPGVSWEELCRPSLAMLCACSPRSLRRA